MRDLFGSFFPFLREVAGNAAFFGNIAALSPVLAGYALCLVRNDIAKERVLRRFLCGQLLAEIEAAGAQSAQHTLPHLEWRLGMERLRWPQA